MAGLRTKEQSAQKEKIRKNYRWKTGNRLDINGG